MSEQRNKIFRYLALVLVAAIVGIAAGDAPVLVGPKVCQVQFRADAFGLPPITPDPTSIIEIARENRATVTGMLKEIGPNWVVLTNDSSDETWIPREAILKLTTKKLRSR